MIKHFLFLTTALALTGTLAHADVYPVLEKYRAVAQQTFELSKNFQTQEDIRVLLFKTRDLVTYGEEIVDLYALKNPSCAEQLNQFKNEIPFMEGQSLDALEERYHDGRGLPKAPRHCYFARSQVIHPVMNMIRLTEGDFSQSVRDQMIHEYEEVIEHLEPIQEFLDNPPN